MYINQQQIIVKSENKGDRFVNFPETGDGIREAPESGVFMQSHDQEVGRRYHVSMRITWKE